MGVRVPFCLGCKEPGGFSCDRGPTNVGNGDLVEMELLELFLSVARGEQKDGGLEEQVK